jgi:biopolymer transport protein ExbB
MGIITELEVIQEFLISGGYVLWVIFLMSLVLWTLILERYWYIWVVYPNIMKYEMKSWNVRTDKTSWRAVQIREAKLSVIETQLNEHLSLIKVLVLLCPMLGLLGTVTGMIHVFDVMAVTGTGNARAMANGVSMATIPTMAGLVTALSGFYFSSRLKFHAINAKKKLEDFVCNDNGETYAA